MILALFTASAVSAATVPETAYGHIAMMEQVSPVEVTKEESVLVEVRPISANLAMASTVADPSTESKVRDYFRDIPVMIEVARCESGFRHSLSDGSVLQGRVDAADTGVMQINKRYHLSTANAMDLNLDDIYDNMAYARHLYETQGIQPWNASASCWNRTLAANI